MILNRRRRRPGSSARPPARPDGGLARWAGPGDVDAAEAEALLARIAALCNLPEALAWLAEARAEPRRAGGELIEQTIARDAGVDVVTVLVAELAAQSYTSCSGRPLSSGMLATTYLISHEIESWLNRNRLSYKGGR